jgi:chromosomal replication initiation ATPase DnaA
MVKLRNSIADSASPSEKALLAQLDIKAGDGQVIISCPSSFVCQIIKKQHHEMISNAIESFSGKKIGVGYEVAMTTRALQVNKPKPVQMMLPSRDMLVSAYGVNPRFTLILLWWANAILLLLKWQRRFLRIIQADTTLFISIRISDLVKATSHIR